VVVVVALARKLIMPTLHSWARQAVEQTVVAVAQTTKKQSMTPLE